MSLVRLFYELACQMRPEAGAFKSLKIPEFPGFRIAISSDGLPTLLLKLDNSLEINSRNLKLRYLAIEYQLKCNICTPSGFESEQLTAIRFLSPEPSLHEFFLKTAERLMKSIEHHLSPNELVNSFNRFAELFRALSDPPRKSIQGLWSELFMIEQSIDSAALADCWHEHPEEKFDFSSGTNKVEVKSFSGSKRLHFFSAEQLDPPEMNQVVVASVHLQKSNRGINIFQLTERIAAKPNVNYSLIEKIYMTISATLGSEIDQSIEIRYDYSDALASLKYYHFSRIPRILLSSLKPEISHVKYQADLSDCEELSPKQLTEMGVLISLLSR